MKATKKRSTGKLIRRTLTILSILFLAYLVIGYFGLKPTQKTPGFMISWVGMFLFSCYVFVRSICPGFTLFRKRH